LGKLRKILSEHGATKNPKRLSDINIASRFIYLNRACFNGLYRVNKNNEFNVPFGSYENPLICDEENLKKIHNVLQKVDILNEDYKEVLKMAKKRRFSFILIHRIIQLIEHLALLVILLIIF